jgi:Xaa-Pro aminopeptidase
MSHAPSAALSARHRAIRSTFERSGIDALIVLALPNVEYVTNFSGSAGIVVVSADRLILLTDSRYATVCAETRGTPHECPAMELAIVEGSYDSALADLVSAGGWPRVGFEAAHLTVSRHEWLNATLRTASNPPTLVGTADLIEDCRLVKDEYELAVLREAGRRLTGIVPAVIGEVRAGRAEHQIAMAIDWRIRDAGFSRTSFETIVASGPNAALPHARPAERRLVEGDLVVLDFGGVYDSYCVDLTRTVSVGTADRRARDVFDAVWQAQTRAIEAVAPGRSRFDVDAAARNLLTDRGFGAAFGHGTGHGLGLEIHEAPRITRRRPDADSRNELLAAGMVFTIEPGAYFPGWGGVRIEDDVAVTEAGVETLTGRNTDLIEV